LNAGSEHAMAQAVHGTAPDIAGKGIANPSALILSTALLLTWFYQRTRIAACRETARLLDRGIRDAIASGAATPDLGGASLTDAFATAVIAALESA
jgi:3-isopropylmalate dehydrogenase